MNETQVKAPALLAEGKAEEQKRNLVLKRKPFSKAQASAREKAQEQRADELIQTALSEATASQPDEVGERLITQVINAQVWPKAENLDDHTIKAITAMAEIAPKTPIEAMLAVQMIAAHDAALMFMYRATLKDQTPDGMDANVMRATRLMRLFNEQLEAMQKLKGKAGQQKVTVEHVHVHQGGQAIVGNVNSNAPGEGVGADAENR